MIERFVKVVAPAALSLALCLTFTAVVQGQAQPTPDAPKPDATQENPEVETPTRKVKPHEYKNWLFSASVGSSLPNGTTAKYVRGGGPTGDAAVAHNFSKYFGFRLDFSFTDLPLRVSALQLAQAPTGNNHVYGLTFDPVVYIPVNPQWSGYVLIGPGYFHRSGELDSSTALPGSVCNAFWDWWGTCLNRSLPLGTFLKESQNEAGYDFGGGIARKVNAKFDVYAEYRALHGSHNGNTTDARTLTLGVRW